MPETPGPNELDSRPQSHREWSGLLRSLVLPLGLVVAIIAGLLFWQSRDDGYQDTEYGTVALPADLNSSDQQPSAVEGKIAPDFLLQTLDGQTLRLSDLRGQPVLINFWASWCTGCRAEIPELIEAYEQDSDLLVVGVNLRESEDRVRGFSEDFGISFPIVFDRDGEVGRTWRIGGPTEGLPSSYFIDRQGVVRKVVFGTLTAKSISEGAALIQAAN